MLSTWWRQPGLAKSAGIAAGIVAAAALAWFTVNTPERGHDPLAADMEKNSALYFAIERDMTRLVHDAKTGTARTIALTDQYALVSLDDGSRYYVRAGEGRVVLAELLASQLAGAKPGTAPAVFSLPDVQPPATPVARMMRVIGPNWLTLVGPLLFIYVIFAMNPLRGPAGLFRLARKPRTRFDDVVGVDEAKEALQDIVAYLKNPAKFSQLGAKPPKGIVLEEIGRAHV